MSRNRVRAWHECGFTVPASSRHVTIHPQAPKMIKVAKDKFEFVVGQEHLYRRFTINELSRIQTFPDNYFVFKNINVAHKMVGNAVPCKLAQAVAGGLIVPKDHMKNENHTSPKIKVSIKPR
jgi:DNA (cytosine-5)-methyltransferase 1